MTTILTYKAMKENKREYPIGGYAPGNYTCRCVTCKKSFFGDKCAIQCEPCATEDYDKQLAQGCIDHIRNAPVVKTYVAKPSGNSGELEDQQDLWDELGNEINKIIPHEDAFGVHPALNILKNKYTITRK